jgi:hypothetical protein
MGHISLNWLEDVLDDGLVILKPIALQPGFIVAPGDDAEVDFDAFGLMDFGVVCFLVDVVDDRGHFELVVFQALLNDVHFVHLFNAEKVRNNLLGTDLLEREVKRVRVLSIEFGPFQFLMAVLDLFAQRLTNHGVGDFELDVHTLVTKKDDTLFTVMGGDLVGEFLEKFEAARAHKWRFLLSMLVTITHFLVLLQALLYLVLVRTD